MDIATIVGVVLGVFLIAMAIVTGGSPLLFIQIPSILIVVGGTAATTLIRFPFPRIRNTGEVLKNAFVEKSVDPEEIIEEMVHISRHARQNGILSLEEYETDDSFLRLGLDLIVDGNPPESVQEILVLDIRNLQRRHREGRDILQAIGEAAPAFGMTGTLIGLVLMLSNLSDPSALGPAMATAIITTLYGVLIANVLALPLAKKLEIRSSEESLNRQLILVAILSILKGENPRHMETAMRAFLARKEAPERRMRPREVQAA